MFLNTTTSISVFNVSDGLGNSDPTPNFISDVINCVHVIIAIASIIIGCFVINIVRKLDDDELLSRFSLLSVLICDVILAASNLTELISLLKLVDIERFNYLSCYFVYVNMLLSSVFSLSLAMSLLCLAVDQVIAVFRPLYFRTTQSIRRKYIYSVIVFSPPPLITVVIVACSLQLTAERSTVLPSCRSLSSVLFDVSLYLVICLASLAFITPCIYAVILAKISKSGRVASENRTEFVKNRKLVRSFFLLSATYIMFWMPILIYFAYCFISATCWDVKTLNISLIMHIIFTFNYLVDPIVCAVRMEPIRKRIRLSFCLGK